MGGNHVPAHPTDEGWNPEGYDESQGAEIVEATQDGPSNGTILIDIPAGSLDDDEIAEEDDLRLLDGELGEEDDDAEVSLEDIREDEIQADLDDDEVDEDELDDETDDGEETSLQP